MVHKLKPILLLFIVAICVIIFSSCPIGIKRYVYYYTPNDELYEYCAFDKSSYWLYEDSATKQIDSIVVVEFYKNQYKTENVARENGGIDEGYVNTFSVGLNIIKEDTLPIYMYYAPTVDYPHPKYSDVNLNQYEYYHICIRNDLSYRYSYINFSSPIETEMGLERTSPIDTYSPSPYCFRYLAFYDSYIVNGHTYRDVKKIEFAYKNYPSDTVICYWAKYIGLIRQEIRYDSIRSVKNIKYYNVINVQNQYE